jgi:hypothetical protein
MRHLLARRLMPGLSVLIVAGLWAMSLPAQPPGPGKGKGPKGPPPQAEFLTVRGTVQEFTTAPQGEIDGLILSDSTWVHWPPHLADRFRDLVVKGDRIKATGYRETGPKGDSKLEVSSLTNLRTNKTRENPDRLPPVASRNGGNSGLRGDEALTVTGMVKEFTTAPKGEVDGLILNDGTWVHWPPHLEDRFAGIAKGDKLKVTGFMETGPKGDTKLEVATLTDLRTSKTSENPDRPLPRSGRLIPGKGGDVEDRLQALEDRIDQLQKQIERLRKK